MRTTFTQLPDNQQFLYNSTKMSFNLGIGQIIGLTQLSWEMFQNTKKAGGVYLQITSELSKLHMVLDNLKKRLVHPRSFVNHENHELLDQLSDILLECEGMLKELDKSLSKYNELSKDNRRIKKLGLKIMFGNTDMKDVSDIRHRIVSYTTNISMLLNILAANSLGKVEESTRKHMQETKGLRKELRWFAKSQRENRVREGPNQIRDDVTVFTAHDNDDKDVWRKFRRQAIEKGYSSTFLDDHMPDLLDYMEKYGKEAASGAKVSSPREASFGGISGWLSDQEEMRRVSCLARTSNASTSKPKSSKSSKKQDRPYIKPKEKHRELPLPEYDEEDEYVKDSDNIHRANTPSRRRVDDKIGMRHENHRDSPPPEYDEADEYDKNKIPGKELSNRRRGNANKLNAKERYKTPQLPEYKDHDEDDQNERTVNSTSGRRVNAGSHHRSQRDPATQTSSQRDHLNSVHNQTQEIVKRHPQIHCDGFRLKYDSDGHSYIDMTSEIEGFEREDSTSYEFSDSSAEDDGFSSEEEEESRNSKIARRLGWRTKNVSR